MPPKKEAVPPSATTIDPTVQIQQNSYIRLAMETSIKHLRQRLEELEKDVDMLRDTRAEIAREANEYMDYSVHELKHKDQEITTLKETLLRQEYEYEQKLQLAANITEEALKEAQKRYTTLEVDMQNKIKDKDIKLERAQEFLELRDQYETQIEELTKLSEQQKERADNAEAAAERRWIVEKKLLERAQEENYAELKRQAKIEVLKAMDEDTKRLISDSKHMSKELTLTSSECRILIEERTTLTETNHTLQRDLDLLKAAEKEWANRNAIKESLNKELETRCSELEYALVYERKARLTEYSQLLDRVQSETEDMRLELNGLKSLMVLKNRELRTIKKLAQIILHQRTEVEQFFLDALTQVKLDIARKKADALEAAKALSTAQPVDLKPILVSPSVGNHHQHQGMYQKYPSPARVISPQKHNQSTKTNGSNLDISNTSSMSLYVTVPGDKGSGNIPNNVTLPDLTAAARRGSPSGLISPNPPAVTAAIASSSKSVQSVKNSRVDIAELTPEDRERVLRLLFAKINNMDQHSTRSARHHHHHHHHRSSTDSPHQPLTSSGSLHTSSSPNHSSPIHTETKQYETDIQENRSDYYSPPDIQSYMESHLSSLNNSPSHKDDSVVEESDNIDSEELAAALGAKAQERVKLASALRQDA